MACPQGVFQAHLLGREVVDLVANGLSLGLGEHTARAQRPAGAPAGQGVQAFGVIGGIPAGDGFAADAEEFGEIGFGIAKLQAMQGT